MAGAIPPGAVRYLRYEQHAYGRAGMHECLSNLRCLVAEAVVHGRRAVLPPLTLTPDHNGGVALAWRWDTYFDLGAGRLVDRARGIDMPLPLAVRAPRTSSMLSLRRGQAMPSRAHRYEVVVRRVGPFYRAHVPRHVVGAARLVMPPAAAVTALAQPPVAQLATVNGGYAAVHVRRGDRMRTARWRDATSPARIAAALGRHGVSRATPAFVLSDERDPAFWQELGARCRLVRYLDFPRLTALVAPGGDHRPDNYLLYEVEKEILRHARIRIGTVRGIGHTAFHGWLLDGHVRDPAFHTARERKDRWRTRLGGYAHRFLCT